jgi:multidrug efflux pump subunit AcrA (membrane-fusion protein)
MRMSSSSLHEPARAKSENAELWARLAAPDLEAGFLDAWLTLLCEEISEVVTAALLTRRADGAFAAIAAWPGRARVGHFRSVVELAAQTGVGQTLTPKDEREAPSLNPPLHIAFPLVICGETEAIVAIELQKRSDVTVQHAMRRLHWNLGRLEALFWRRRANSEAARSTKAVQALTLIAAADETDRLPAAALALCNAVAAELTARRVSIGMLRGRRLRLTATSGAANFKRGSRLVRALEAAMEEAIESGASLRLPAPDKPGLVVDAAHNALCEESGSSSATTVLLLADSCAVGAVTVEFDTNTPTSDDALALLEMTAALVGPGLAIRQRGERLVTGRLLWMLSAGMKRLTGPRFLVTKLIAAVLVIAGIALALGEGRFRVTGESVLEGFVQRATIAPFDGFISAAEVRVGDSVLAGQDLLRLNDRDLRLERAKWQSDRQKLEQQLREAVANRDRTATALRQAELQTVEAELALVEERLTRATVRAPIDGVVIAGDFSHRIGSPIRQGDLLFEIAPATGHRVSIQIAEQDIGHVAIGQIGFLVLKGVPEQPLGIKVSRMTAVSEAREGRNRFRVEATIDSEMPQLRPGMEGIAKIEIDQRPLLWIWTRGLVEWLRLQLWQWTP